jgi:hypothetical protein
MFKDFCRLVERYPHIKVWPLRSETPPGQKNVAHPPVVDKSNIHLPPLHIKLALIKIFVKAIDKESEGFTYLREKLPKISEAKIKEGIFVGPEIKQLFEDHDFNTKLNST